MNTLTNCENAVLRKMLEGEHPSLGLLREQAARAQVASREFTGVGFFTDLTVPALFRLPGGPSFQLADVVGSVSNLRNGVGFVLFIEDGLLSLLEGYSFDEPWPEKLENLDLQYLNSNSSTARDLPEGLRAT